MKTITILIFATSLNFLCASEQRAPEQGAMGDVIHGIQLFEALHSGQSPTNWSQISETLNLAKVDQSLEQNGFSALEKNYVFIERKIAVPEYEKGDVVLMRTAPITIEIGETNKEEGRYIISRYEGSLRFNWLSENKVQKMLADAGATNLPAPEPFISSSDAREVVPMNKQADKALPVISPQKSVEPQATETPSLSPVESTNPPTATPSTPTPSSKWPLIILIVAVFGLSFAFFRKKGRK